MNRRPDDIETEHVIETLELEVARLREALERVMIGGNHLVTIIGADHPPATATHDAAMAHYGAGHAYDAWCCWQSIMKARAALEGEPITP